jgi:hypothetical protein
MRLPRILSVTAAAVAVFAAPGCTRMVTGTAVQGTGAAGAKSTICKQVSAPMAPIPSRAAGQPLLRIPQPAGWQRTSILDSEIIRYAMGNKDLAADHFAPTAVVTLESAPGTTEDQQKIFDQERAMLSDRLAARLSSSATTPGPGPDSATQGEDAHRDRCVQRQHLRRNGHSPGSRPGQPHICPRYADHPDRVSDVAARRRMITSVTFATVVTR